MLARTASTLGLMLALSAAPAAASIVVSLPAASAVPAVGVVPPPTTTTYTFAGQCSDCSGTAGAELVLQNYTLGNDISTSNFVSFHYDGTDLLSGFTVTSSNVQSVGGAIDGPLPAAEDFYIFGSGMYFQSQNEGYWCTGGACLSDYGSAHLWNAITTTPPVASVPEPISASLLGTGLCAAFVLRRRRD